ncbi:MAG: sigma-70 family RNA polymerase sigma factor [Bacteroidetes bacterium]|nr:sigma-70 family RNA polymerase sigma factor [Bacteroidota bacterium]
MKDTFNELELINRYAQHGDREAVGLLFKQSRSFAYGIARKYYDNDDDAKDAVMNVFEQLLATLKTQRPDNFRAWLHHVVKNHCLMDLRKQNAKMRSDDAIKLNYYANVESETDLHLEQNKEAMLNGLEEAINTLKDQQQVCIRMMYLENKSYQDIQSQTGFTFNDVKSHIQNGKRNLKIIMMENLKKIQLIVLLYLFN